MEIPTRKTYHWSLDGLTSRGLGAYAASEDGCMDAILSYAGDTESMIRLQTRYLGDSYDGIIDGQILYIY